MRLKRAMEKASKIAIETGRCLIVHDKAPYRIVLEDEDGEFGSIAFEVGPGVGFSTSAEGGLLGALESIRKGVSEGNFVRIVSTAGGHVETGEHMVGYHIEAPLNGWRVVPKDRMLKEETE